VLGVVGPVAAVLAVALAIPFGHQAVWGAALGLIVARLALLSVIAPRVDADG